MKNKEVMRRVFGFGFNSIGKYNLYCTNTPCGLCPLNHRCDGKGMSEFMDDEYKPFEEGININEIMDENSETYKAIFEKGKQAGRDEVYDSLAKIFERKSE